MSVSRGPWSDRPSFEEFQPFSPARWEGAKPPPQDWLVDGCFMRGSVAILAGDGGLGKSLLLQQLTTCMALGKPWLGMATQRGRALMIFCEDDMDELHRRQTAINAHYGCDMGDLAEDVLMESRVGRDSVLMHFGRYGAEFKRAPLLEQIRHKARQFGPSVIGLDTLADVFNGNEVDRNQPRTFIRELRKLAIECQACVVLTQHPSLTGMSTGTGMSGSTGWNNSVRSRIYLTRPKGADGGDARVLKTMKSNSSATGGKIELKWQRGVFVRHEPPPARAWSEPEMQW